MRSGMTSAAVVVVCAGAALGQVRVEVTPEGRSAVVRPSATDGMGFEAGSGVPFGTEPDQEIELRRQIGGLQVADVDGDGLNDVIAVCYISNSFPPYEEWEDQIYFNLGGSIEAEPSWLSNVETHTGDVRVGDVNGDGFVDVVTVHGGGLRTDSVRVYYGSADGPDTSADWVSQTPQACWGTSGMLVDLDNDGDSDLVTTNQGLSPDPFRPMYQFENEGEGLGTVPVWESAEQSIQNGLASGDLDGDGFVDIAVAKWVNFESGVYMNGGGTLATVPSWTVGAEGTDKGAGVADVDGDGLLDVAYGGDPATQWGNQGDGTFAQVWESEAEFQGPQDFRFFDVDGDGDEDLAEIHFSTGRCHIYLNEDGALSTTPSWTFDAPEVGTSLAFGDINGDGAADLATGYSGDVSVRVFLAEPASCPGDFNGDGELSVLDFIAFQNAFVAGDESADCDGNGALDVLDFVCFQDVFQEGCD